MSSQQEALLQAFRISQDDLSVNRLGKLSVAQEQKLLVDAKRSLILTVPFSFLLTAPIYLIFYKAISEQYIWIVGIAGIVLFVVQLVLVLMYGIKHLRQTQAAITNGRVESFLGEIELGKSVDDGGWWFTTPDGQFFQLPSLHSCSISNHRTYRAYIVSGIRRIVAIESMYKD